MMLPIENIMANPAELILNITKDPNPKKLGFDSSNSKMVSKRGYGCEKYTMDFLAGTRGVKNKKSIWKKCFLYKGSSNRPPDCVSIFSGIEVKKMESFGWVQLNSSRTTCYLDPDNNKYKEDCRKIIKSLNKRLPFFYSIVNVKDKEAQSIFFIDGLCLGKHGGEVFKDVLKKGVPIAESEGHEAFESGSVSFDTNEVAIYKTDDGNYAERLRVFALVPHPQKQFSYIEEVNITADFKAIVLITKENYMEIPEASRKNMEDFQNCQLPYGGKIRIKNLEIMNCRELPTR